MGAVRKTGRSFRPSRVESCMLRGLDAFLGLVAFGLGGVFRRILRSFFRSVATFDGRTTEAAFATAARGTAFAAGTTEATRAAAFTTGACATAAHHLAQLGHGGDILFFAEAAIGVCVHAFEALFGITKHAAHATAGATLSTRAAFTGTAHAFGAAGRAAFRTRTALWTWATFGARTALWAAWGTTETAITTTAGRASRATFATGAACSTVAHALCDLGELLLVDEAVRIGVCFAKAVFIFLAVRGGEFVLADLAVAVGVGTLDELGETACCVATATGAAWRRTFGTIALLGAGKTGTEADEAQAADE